MRKLECELCGHIHIPQSRGRGSYKKRNPDFTCSKCGHKNKQSLRGRRKK